MLKRRPASPTVPPVVGTKRESTKMAKPEGEGKRVPSGRLDEQPLLTRWSTALGILCLFPVGRLFE